MSAGSTVQNNKLWFIIHTDPSLGCFDQRDAKCGKIQCQGGANRPVIGTNAVSIETNIPLHEGGRILCRGTHVYLGDDMPDPGLVLTGTKCGDGMVWPYSFVWYLQLKKIHTRLQNLFYFIPKKSICCTFFSATLFIKREPRFCICNW